ncbi:MULTISPECIES: hypothetical protein [Pseudoalteromonas]|mgnify:FL=1|uniref:hypothetical protein n=1 Tax=Pseudoalteromonas TaxID=53246 RepID=UPI0006CA19CB|nr:MULTISPECIES: hypothetical protein [Pseudoalteromonas]KPM79085.1 hypothetical protein AOG26_06280 [Pseudoalteromonas sp. UCD-33C]KPW04597.1 hypothetical protein AN213_00086 [Pseudoalteromonas sp. P1-8]KPZ67530.1 hypothetical protein AN394_03601 [Pseudoalteromonas sp. P1-26]MDK9683925.1 hypothetical protein [Pseudoalteromonas shioyasakiensis]URQ85042.1 hypothetical protein J8Z28_10540 [Pseudoalteromonas sp. SCSIO 43088]
MNIKNMGTALVLGLIALSSSHSQGSTADSAYQGAQLIVILFECILIALPTTAFLLVIWSRWKHLRFKQLLQTVLNSSLVFMLISLVTINQLTQSMSSWLIALAVSHTLLVGISYLLVKQHTNRVKSTLTGCW